MMNRWQRLFEGIRTEIKVFIFFSVLLTAFRIVFLAVFQSQLASVTMENILTSLWLGFRLSLKTVGSLCLLGFLGGTLVHTFVPKWPSLRVKQVLYSIATILLTFLFWDAFRSTRYLTLPTMRCSSTVKTMISAPL